MGYRLLADGVVALHLGFVLFVVAGGVLVRWRRWVAFVHLPCAVYGFAIELWGWICPLTPLENHLRSLAGDRGYAGGFVEHYLVGVLYPEPLTRAMQVALGLFVLVVNGALYGWALSRRVRRAGSL